MNSRIPSFLQPFANMFCPPKKKETIAEHPIFNAVYIGDFGAVKAILDKDPKSVECVDSTGNTPLTIAAGGNYCEIIDALVAAGARVNVPGNNGYTPLNAAAHEGHVEAVKKLIELRADTEARATVDHHATPLLSAVINVYPGIVMLLADAGADVNATTFSGHSAVAIAADRNRYGLVETLMCKGADAELADKNAQSAKQAAQLNKRMLDILNADYRVQKTLQGDQSRLFSVAAAGSDQNAAAAALDNAPAPLQKVASQPNLHSDNNVTSSNPEELLRTSSAPILALK